MTKPEQNERFQTHSTMLYTYETHPWDADGLSAGWDEMNNNDQRRSCSGPNGQKGSADEHGVWDGSGD